MKKEMQIRKFFDGIRETYLLELPSSLKKTEENKIKKIDGFVLDNLKKNHKFYYILNNKLSGYLLFLKEKGLYSKDIDSRITRNTYERFQRMVNTSKFLSYLGKKTDTKFLLIKSLNILPYFPVNDLDVMVNDIEKIQNSVEFFENYHKSSDKEYGKLNYLPNEPSKFFKLSFHFDLTWDEVKIKNIEIKNPWTNCIKLFPQIYLNSPIVEATIKLQECLLENLHFKLIDHLYVSHYLEERYSFFLKKYSQNRYPYFLKFSDIIKHHRNRRLLLKNLRRFIVWKLYSEITGKVPFRERCEESI